MSPDDPSLLPPVTIRLATPADADRIVRPYRDSAEHHAALDPERYFVPSAEFVAARYRDGEQHTAEVRATSVTLVAEVEREIVGFVDVKLGRSLDAMHRDMTYCHILEIAVSADRRRGGVGAALLHAAEVWGRGRGATFASLEYHAANTDAAKFYERQQYRTAAVTAIKRL